MADCEERCLFRRVQTQQDFRIRIVCWGKRCGDKAIELEELHWCYPNEGSKRQKRGCGWATMQSSQLGASGLRETADKRAPARVPVSRRGAARRRRRVLPRACRG